MHKWCLCSTDGCFTAPEELEVPVKYIDNGRVGNVWDYRAEFLQQANEYECQSGIEGILQEVNTFYTEYDGPKCPFRVLAKPLGEETDACITIKGLTCDGQEVRTHFNETPIAGEKIQICYAEPKYTQTSYSPVLGQIVKTETKYPVELSWYAPETKEEGFLALLPARNQVTTFRRFRLKAPCTDNHRLIILGRIRFKSYYEDSDVLPFTLESLYLNTAQMLRSQDQNQLDISQVKEGIIQRVIDKQNNYTKTPNGVMSINVTTLPRRRGVIHGFIHRGRWW